MFLLKQIEQLIWSIISGRTILYPNLPRPFPHSFVCRTWNLQVTSHKNGTSNLYVFLASTKFAYFFFVRCMWSRPLGPKSPKKTFIGDMKPRWFQLFFMFTSSWGNSKSYLTTHILFSDGLFFCDRIVSHANRINFQMISDDCFILFSSCWQNKLSQHFLVKSG